MALEAEQQAEVAERLRGLRKKNGLKVRHIAEALDVSQRAVQGWLAGEYGIDLDKLGKLAELLKTTPNYILQGDAEPGETPDLALNGRNGRPQLDRIEQALADISERLDALGALTIRVALALNLPDEEEDTEAAAQGAEEAAEQPDSQPERSAPASRGRRKAAQAQ